MGMRKDDLTRGAFTGSEEEPGKENEFRQAQRKNMLPADT
jgi:hypothetical protein